MDPRAPATVTTTGTGPVGRQGKRSASGTVMVSSLGDAAVTAAATPATVTVFSAGFAANPPPVMVAVMPGRSTAGAMEVMVGVVSGAAATVKTVLPAPSTEAGARCSPTWTPSTQTASARPSGPLAPPEMVPPPEMTVQFTAPPGMGSPRLSSTRTASDTLVPAVAEMGLGVSGSTTAGVRGPPGSSQQALA